MKNSIFILVILLTVTPTVLAFNPNEYQYYSDIKVHCGEYKGNVRFELPSEYTSLKNPKSYMTIDHSIDRNKEGGSYYEQQNWFIKQIENQQVSEVEKIFDNNHNTYLLSQNTQNIEFTFENPNSQPVEKISIDLRDSSIKSITIYNQNQKVDFTQNRNNFHYELLFSAPVNTNSLKFIIEYDNIIKIKEISLFSYQTYNDKSFAYFYVDNNCIETFRFYFGEYGESNAKSGSRSLPVEFDITTNTYKNSLYQDDFDNDSIKNDQDNCLEIANTDQKDINYNSIGDACEDDDNDRIQNSIDNCIEIYNPNQLDGDQDGIGNACDSDDGRFFEQNKYLLFIFAALIAIIFVVVSIVLMRKK